MNRRFSALVAGVIAHLCIAQALVQNVAVAQTKTITIKGTVKGDESNAPIAGVEVAAYRAEIQVASDRTTKEGTYKLVISSGVKLKLVFTHSAYNPVIDPNVPGDRDQEIDKLLEPVNERMASGTITSIMGDRMVVKSADGKDVSFTLTPTTEIVVAGKVGKLSDLKAGAKVKVTYAAGRAIKVEVEP